LNMLLDSLKKMSVEKLVKDVELALEYDEWLDGNFDNMDDYFRVDGYERMMNWFLNEYYREVRG